MKTLKYATLLFAAALAISGLSALNSRAADSPGENNAPGARFREHLKEKLDLSDDQFAQIKSQLVSDKANLTRLLNRMQNARTQLRAAIQQPGATETSVRAAAARLSTVESDLAVERFKLWGKISPLLTADQRVKLARLEAGLDQFIEHAIDRIDFNLSQ
jgi:Spy/CpxP family protein refolding chaperone